MRHSSIKQQSVAKKEPQQRQYLIAVHESKTKFVKWWNDGMAEWRNGGMAEWRNGGMAKWRNGGMAEW